MIVGAGFALMAWREAKRRAEVPLLPRCFTPNREHAKNIGKSSWHYYAIIDDAWAAWNNEHLGAVAFAGIPVSIKL